MLEIAKGIFLFFGVPLLMFIGAQWDPFWSLNEDGEPNRLGMFFVLVPYWILLFFWWKYREKSREYAGDIGILTSPLFSDDERELVNKWILDKKKNPYYKDEYNQNDIKKGETIHVILEVSDSREMNLTRYQRVIITAN